MKRNTLDALIEDYLEGRLSDADAARLSTLLEASAEARARFWESASIHGLLEHALQNASLRILTGEEFAGNGKAAGWLAWRPLTAAAAAGLALGMLCTSVVFAYVSPGPGKAVSVLQESFESIPPPHPAGVPVSANQWSGDFAEIVGAQRGVTPHSGKRMWRFLRADNAQQAESPSSYVGEAIRVVDLRPLRSAGLKAGSQLEISGWFAAGEIPRDSRFYWNIKAATFEGSVTEAPALWGKWDQASSSLSQRETPVQQAGSWQHLSVTMLLSPSADFLVFECAVVQREPVVERGAAEFPAHYVDDVRVRLLPPSPEAQTVE